MNQAWVQRIAATPDAAHLAIATHDGERLTVARFARGAQRAERVVSLASKGAATALALSPDGAFVAVGSESRGREAPGQAWLLDASGAVVWTTTFAKAVAGAYFLPDGSLIVAGEGRVVRVPVHSRPARGRRAPRIAARPDGHGRESDRRRHRARARAAEGDRARPPDRRQRARDRQGPHRPRVLRRRVRPLAVEQVARGSRLRLEFDVGERDRFGRLLAYAYRPDGTFLNAALVRSGYAQTMTIPPNVAHADEFRALERTARREERGLWGACRTARG